MTDAVEAIHTVLACETLEPNEWGTVYTLLLEHRTAGYTPGTSYVLPEMWEIVERTDKTATGRGIGHEYRGEPFSSLKEAQSVFTRRTQSRG